MAVPGSSMGSELIVPGAVAGSQRWLLGTLLEYVCYQEHEEIQVSWGGLGRTLLHVCLKLNPIQAHLLRVLWI
jgi:hypothetical protein